MNNQTTERIKESLVSSSPRSDSGSDLLSVRGPNSKDESDLLSAVKIKDDSESLPEASFSGDNDENITDPCAVCFTDRKFPNKATHFCDDCGLLGHFLCEQCLGFHKKFTKHKSVKSFTVAKNKRGEFNALQTENDLLKQENKNLNEEKHNLDEKLRHSTEQVTAKEKEIETLKKEQKELQRNYETIQKDIQKMMINEEIKAREMQDKTKKLRSAQDELDELKNRYVGATKMNDNPNITDLSELDWYDE